MSTEPAKILKNAAEKVRVELAKVAPSDFVLKEAHDLLEPLVAQCLRGDDSNLPAELPKRNFFFGMYDHCLAGRHLELVDLLNAIGELGDALQLHAKAKSLGGG
ncbi:MAG: hypothetical protein EOP24_34960 [Hyphomicrobiales bacterium]|nr:MAG: hypothetical protein EOP24_34960 [Hyphomicrobiales bacterium]